MITLESLLTRMRTMRLTHDELNVIVGMLASADPGLLTEFLDHLEARRKETTP